ncbi:MAG: hypothetical protein ACO1OB_17810 [Archangium sp.]
MSNRLFVSLCFLALAACGKGPNTGTGGGTANTGGGSGGAGGGMAPVSGATYYKDVLPITQVSCNGCHTAGGIAPFPLDSYEAAKSKAALMSDAVKNKRMPPWPAAKDCGGTFVGDRTLTDTQIATIEGWFFDDAPEGNPADAPTPIDMTAEQLPKVDFEGKMAASYTPTIKDDYRCFIIDPALTQGKTVTGYDIVPGSKKVVHHVILYLVDRATAVNKDAEDTKAGWECFGGADVNTAGALGAWAPGGAAVVYPTRTGIRVTPSQVLAMQVHYNTDNGSEADETSLKLMYGSGTETQAYLLPVVADNFAIPPNAQDYKHSENFDNPTKGNLNATIKLWGFMPHMHTRGRAISIKSGDECLVDVPNWDFHWQTQYFRRSPFLLPATSQVTMNCSWDNPSNSTIRWGEGTSDEMCFAFIYATL